MLVQSYGLDRVAETQGQKALWLKFEFLDFKNRVIELGFRGPASSSRGTAMGVAAVGFKFMLLRYVMAVYADLAVMDYVLALGVHQVKFTGNLKTEKDS